MDLPLSIPVSVLVVEDVLLDRKVTPVVEQIDDVIVLAADNGPAAMSVLRGHPVALALLDLENPGVNAFALAESIRATEHTREMPIVFLGQPERMRGFESEWAGSAEFLAKPIDPHILRSKVGAYAELYRQRRGLADQVEKLERIAQVNARVVSALSHDIRTPLSVIMINAELVLRRAETPAIRQAAERMKAAASALSHQIVHLVNVARTPKSDLHPQIDRFDLAELVQERMSTGAGHFLLGTELSCDSDGDTSCQADRVLVEQAIDQLLLVVATYGDGARVRAKVNGSSPRSLTLRIETGTILPETAKQYLFGSRLPDPRLGVSGLGVALDEADRIARAHGGSLIGDSREREGTFFELMLPRR
jgi:signal transduction histidine kinase